MTNGTRKPKLKAPPGSCDTHIHLVGPLDRFPIPPEAAIKPPEATLVDFLAMLDRLGLERTVDVHVKNLRRKIEADPAAPTYVVTVYGVGYKMADDAP